VWEERGEKIGDGDGLKRRKEFVAMKLGKNLLSRYCTFINSVCCKVLVYRGNSSSDE